MPGKQGRRGHGKHLAPPAAWDQPGEGCEPQAVGWLILDPVGMAAQHGVLMSQHQEFGFLRNVAPSQQHQAVEQAAREQVGD